MYDSDLIFMVIVFVVIIAASLGLLGYSLGPPHFRGRHEYTAELRPSLVARWRSRATPRPRLLVPALPEHEGATEGWSPKAEQADMDTAPELESAVDEELRWGLAWHEFERGMQREIDEAFAPYLSTGIYDFEELQHRLLDEDALAGAAA